ncbi:hypothetical protein SBBP1_920012 [Burkholderiales bacterium]|nr:hypothetical protein SBBP1_920012 [Burkholderiales bacterium]
MRELDRFDFGYRPMHKDQSTWADGVDLCARNALARHPDLLGGASRRKAGAVQYNAAWIPHSTSSLSGPAWRD